MERLAQTIPEALVELLRNTPMSAGKVEFAWKTAVGPAVDRVTAVRLDGTILIVEAQTQAWSREVTRSSHVILKRMQSLLGDRTITRITLRHA